LNTCLDRIHSHARLNSLTTRKICTRRGNVLILNRVHIGRTASRKNNRVWLVINLNDSLGTLVCNQFEAIHALEKVSQEAVLSRANNVAMDE